MSTSCFACCLTNASRHTVHVVVYSIWSDSGLSSALFKRAQLVPVFFFYFSRSRLGRLFEAAKKKEAKENRAEAIRQTAMVRVAKASDVIGDRTRLVGHFIRDKQRRGEPQTTRDRFLGTLLQTTKRR